MLEEIRYMKKAEKQLFDKTLKRSILWMEFNCLKAAESLQGGRSLIEGLNTYQVSGQK